MNSFKVHELTTKQQMHEQLHLITQLTSAITLEKYSDMLDDMLAHGYRQIGVFDGDKCVALSGFWISTKIYSGKYVELDNVVVDKAYRSQGLGKLMCDWILEEAKDKGCKTAMLDAYIENEGAHTFYEREGFFKRGYHFIKHL